MKFLVAIHHPNDYDAAATEDAAMTKAIDDLNDEMHEAGAHFFAGGLHGNDGATTIQTDAQGNIQVTPGPFLKIDMHVGGFWILDCASLEDAVEWGRKATVACRAPVEVRPFF